MDIKQLATYGAINYEVLKEKKNSIPKNHWIQILNNQK